MNFIITGTNYKYSPIELREKISFSKKRLSGTLSLLKERNVLKSAVILSTCNRVEVYAAAVDTEAGFREIEDFIFRYHEVEKKEFLPHLYRYMDKEAMRHLLMVTSGLDSLILGETEIFGQVKYAFSESEKMGFVDSLLRRIFYQAFSLTKKIRTETKISEGKVSCASVAIDFIKERIGSLSGKNILIIGIGKVTELVLEYLKQERPRVVFISNRTFEKAKELAREVDGVAVRFDQLKEKLKEADIIISATSSPHLILRKEDLAEIGKALLLIDLAVPRDIDPQIKFIKGISLFDLDDLNFVIEKSLEKRNLEIPKAEQIIKQEVENLCLKEHLELEPEPVNLP